MRKSIFILVFIGFTASVSYSQEKSEPFIEEMQKVFEKREKQYKRISDKALRKHNTGTSFQEYEQIIIPKLLLKKTKKLYEKVDTTNMVQYFNPKSMFYSLALVYNGSSYEGRIYEFTKKNYVYSSKPEIEKFVFEELFLKIKEIQPDIVFEVQSVGQYFYIKDKKIYALVRSNGNVAFISYPIEEYTKEFFDDDIYLIFLRYVPRLYPIICM